MTGTCLSRCADLPRPRGGASGQYVTAVVLKRPVGQGLSLQEPGQLRDLLGRLLLPRHWHILQPRRLVSFPGQVFIAGSAPPGLVQLFVQEVQHDMPAGRGQEAHSRARLANSTKGKSSLGKSSLWLAELALGAAPARYTHLVGRQKHRPPHKAAARTQSRDLRRGSAPPLFILPITLLAGSRFRFTLVRREPNMFSHPTGKECLAPHLRDRPTRSPQGKVTD